MYALVYKSLIDFNEAFTHYNELQFLGCAIIVVHLLAVLMYVTYQLVILVHRKIQVTALKIR